MSNNSSIKKESSTDGDNSSIIAQREPIPNQNPGDITSAKKLSGISANVPNGVDFILEMFAEDVDSKPNGEQDLDKDDVTLPEIDDEVNFYYDSSEGSECTDSIEASKRTEATNQSKSNLMFDPELKSSYGFTQLNVSDLFYFTKNCMLMTILKL